MYSLNETLWSNTLNTVLLFKDGPCNPREFYCYVEVCNTNCCAPVNKRCPYDKGTIPNPFCPGAVPIPTCPNHYIYCPTNKCYPKIWGN